MAVGGGTAVALVPVVKWRAGQSRGRCAAGGGEGIRVWMKGVEGVDAGRRIWAGWACMRGGRRGCVLLDHSILFIKNRVSVFVDMIIKTR